VTTATKVRIKPLEDRVVVQANEAETTTASGLVIPDTAKEKPQEGTVIAVGPGRIDDKGQRVPMDVAEGDTVIYSKYGGTEVKYGGEDYLVLSARDLLAVVEKQLAPSVKHNRFNRTIGTCDPPRSLSWHRGGSVLNPKTCEGTPPPCPS